MTDVAAHWAGEDLIARVEAAMAAEGLTPETTTVEALSPLDHFHARGFPATVELADALDVRPGDRLVDIGCGIGGPSRYFAQRFGCTVEGIDLTPPFIELARRLTALTGLSERVHHAVGDAMDLPFEDESFDGALCQHVTMNIADRAGFFAGVFRVLKPGGFFALTEHGLGPAGDPHHPLPWSDDGSGAYLVTPEETRARLGAAGFTGIEVADTGPAYLAGYEAAIAKAEAGTLPAFGTHILIGPLSPQKTRNAARNIAEGRTAPIRVVCRKPA